MNLFSLEGKTILVMGALNDHSLGFGIAKAVSDAGAKVLLTCQSEKLLSRVQKLADSINATAPFLCDVSDDAGIEAFAESVRLRYAPIHGLVHSIAFADRNELRGPYVRHTTRRGFQTAMDVSVFSLTDLCNRLEPAMADGASIVTLSFYASTRIFANYNVMAVAKAALEASVRSLAVDFGPRKIRVNAISASPANTLAAAGISHKHLVGDVATAMSPLSRLATLEEVGATGAFLLSPASGAITGATLPVNCGAEITAHAPAYNVEAMIAAMTRAAEAKIPYIGKEYGDGEKA